MKLSRSVPIETSSVEQQNMFYLHLELNAVEFYCLISQDDFNTFRNFVIDEYTNSNGELLINDLLVYELGKRLYCELKELLAPNKLKFNRIKILKNQDDMPSLNVQGVDYPIKSLYGSNLRIGANNFEDLEAIINTIQCKKVYLDKYIGLYNRKHFTLFGIKFGFEVQENTCRILDQKQYLKLKIQVNSQQEVVFLSKELIKHLVFAYLEKLPNLEIKNLPKFSYNEFYTQLAISVLQTMVGSIGCGIIEINSWEYSSLPYESYVVSKLSVADHSFNIYFANLNTEFLDLVMEKKMLVNQKLFDKSYILSVPVIYSSTEIATKDLKSLRIGDTVLFPNIKNKLCYINLIKNSLAAELIATTQIKIIS